MLKRNSYLQAIENGLYEDSPPPAPDVQKMEPVAQNATIKIIRTNIEVIQPESGEVRSESVIFRQKAGNMDQVAGERRSIMEMFNLEQVENLEYKDLLMKAEEEDKEALAVKRYSGLILPPENPPALTITPPMESASDIKDTISNSVTIPAGMNSDTNSSYQLVYTGRNSMRRGRRSPENGGIRAKHSQRVVFRNGDINVPLIINIPAKTNKFMKDLVTTLIDMKWRWLTLLFIVSHFVVWLVFALLFYLSAYANGDLSDDPPPILCITEGKTFTGIFGFSVESQVSIGYGEKSPTEQCPELAFTLLMEVIVGYVLLGIMVGVFFAKSVRPEKKLVEVGFSKKAVICMRDGKLCLVFRVWDLKQYHIIGTSLKARIIKHVVAGPVISNLKITPENPVMLWPITAQHEINEHSPLYDMSAKDFVDKRVEIIITLTGASKNTGQMTQSRTSYLSKDILWGQRFVNILSYDRKIGKFRTDIQSLNTVQPINIPLCSAQLLDKLAKMENETPSISSIGSPGWSFRFRPEATSPAST